MGLSRKLLLLSLCVVHAQALWPFSGAGAGSNTKIVAEVGQDGSIDEAAAAAAPETTAKVATATLDNAAPATDTSSAAAAVAESSASLPEGQVSITFTNLSPTAMDVFWDDGHYGKVVAHKVEPRGGQTQISTYIGHKFFWAVHGRRQAVGEDITVAPGVASYTLPADVSVAVDTSACQDRHRRCPTDARNGECVRNPGWMIVNCPAACDKCDMLDMKKRCDRKLPHLNMSDSPQWAPGDLDALFEDIVTNERWAAYRPTALSRPPEGPWVVAFEDVVADTEIAALTSTVAKDFERSTDTGAANEFGEAQKLMSTGRTSENAWCIGPCYAHPEVQNLTARIEHVTRVPSGHYENFQVLRYTPGQFYRTHHDMSPADNAIPCGPRILTFFLYLSDVEEGGGTNFPRLDLTVQPKKGSAVLWPSVLNEDPTQQDPRTHHQALPVTKGTKFAANAWIHLYDYKKPNLWGCTGAFG